MEDQIKIRKTTLETCHDATGVVVVIDVLRAFTTSAFAFERGAMEIMLVSTVEEAFDLRRDDPDCLLVGEVDALPIDGFDYSNSPSALEGLDLGMRRLVLRTTAGTQGAVLATRADHLFVASLVVASATSEYIKALNPDVVTFVETGVKAEGGGEEDVAGADYISSLILDSPIDFAQVKERVLSSRAAAKFADPERPAFPSADLDCVLQVDRFPFAMKVEREHGRPVLRNPL